MPQRTSQHATGDQAAARVSQLFVDAGCAVDRVPTDYGEDLLVQTHHEGTMDPSRIWIQVKGTRKPQRYKRKAGYGLRVSLDHALKWARTADMVLVVLWDLEADRGYWTDPTAFIDQWDLYLLDRKTVTLVFSEDDVLDSAAVARLIWRSRVEHYEKLVLAAAFYSEQAEAFDFMRDHRSVLPLILFDFFRLIGFFGEDRLHPEVVEGFANACDNIEPDSGESEKDVRNMAAMLAYMAHVDNVTGAGLPHALALHGGAMASALLFGDMGKPFRESGSTDAS